MTLTWLFFYQFYLAFVFFLFSIRFRVQSWFGLRLGLGSVLELYFCLLYEKNNFGKGGGGGDEPEILKKKWPEKSVCAA